jgi:hypothetical protein
MDFLDRIWESSQFHLPIILTIWVLTFLFVNYTHKAIVYNFKSLEPKFSALSTTKRNARDTLSVILIASVLGAFWLAINHILKPL